MHRDAASPNHSATSNTNGQNPKIPHDIVKNPGEFANTTVINAAMLSTRLALHEKPNICKIRFVRFVYNWLKLQDLDFASYRNQQRQASDV